MPGEAQQYQSADLSLSMFDGGDVALRNTDRRACEGEWLQPCQDLRRTYAASAAEGGSRRSILAEAVKPLKPPFFLQIAQSIRDNKSQKLA